VTIKFLVCKGTLDDALWAMLEKKLLVIGRSLNGAVDQLDVQIPVPIPAVVIVADSIDECKAPQSDVNGEGMFMFHEVSKT
jgi:hypothetical protein